MFYCHGQALAECKEIRRQLEGTTVQLQKAGECRNNDGTTMEKNSVNFAEDLQVLFIHIVIILSYDHIHRHTT